jgi:hypothetical protein
VTSFFSDSERMDDSVCPVAPCEHNIALLAAAAAEACLTCDNVPWILIERMPGSPAADLLIGNFEDLGALCLLTLVRLPPKFTASTFSMSSPLKRWALRPSASAERYLEYTARAFKEAMVPLALFHEHYAWVIELRGGLGRAHRYRRLHYGDFFARNILLFPTDGVAKYRA